MLAKAIKLACRVFDEAGGRDVAHAAIRLHPDDFVAVHRDLMFPLAKDDREAILKKPMYICDVEVFPSAEAPRL